MLDRAQKHVVASSLAGLALLFFDQTAVIIALPAIAQDFGSTALATQWTVTAYLLALAVFMPLVGRVADRYGRKSVLLTGWCGSGSARRPARLHRNVPIRCGSSCAVPAAKADTPTITHKVAANPAIAPEGAGPPNKSAVSPATATPKTAPS